MAAAAEQDESPRKKRRFVAANGDEEGAGQATELMEEVVFTPVCFSVPSSCSAPNTLLSF